MDIANFLIKNIDRWLSDNIEFWDYIFVVTDNLSTNPLTRYTNFVNKRNFHARAKSWEFNTDIQFPFVTYYVEDFEDGRYRQGCTRKANLVFRFAIKYNQLIVDPDIKKVNDELEWLTGIQKVITNNIEANFNIFRQNECKPTLYVSCINNVITEITESFKHNIRAEVSGAIRYSEIPVRNNEFHEYEMSIPLYVYKTFTSCPC